MNTAQSHSRIPQKIHHTLLGLSGVINKRGNLFFFGGNSTRGWMQKAVLARDAFLFAKKVTFKREAESTDLT